MQRLMMAGVGVMVVSAGFAEEVRLVEVAVTALRDLRLDQKAPVFVSVIDAEESFSGQQAVLNLSSKAPAIRFMQSSGPLTTSARIHGIGNLGNLPNFETDVGLYIQGMYQARQGLLTPQLFDVSSVEVVSGSQATLYGRNVNAGAVLVNYREPSASNSAAVNATLGMIEGARTASTASSTGHANLVLGEDAVIRMRVSYKFGQSGSIDRNLYQAGQDTLLGEARDEAVRAQVATDVGMASMGVSDFLCD